MKVTVNVTLADQRQWNLRESNEILVPGMIRTATNSPTTDLRAAKSNEGNICDRDAIYMSYILFNLN